MFTILKRAPAEEHINLAPNQPKRWWLGVFWSSKSSSLLLQEGKYSITQTQIHFWKSNSLADLQLLKLYFRLFFLCLWNHVKKRCRPIICERTFKISGIWTRKTLLVTEAGCLLEISWFNTKLGQRNIISWDTSCFLYFCHLLKSWWTSPRWSIIFPKPVFLSIILLPPPLIPLQIQEVY